MRGMKRLRVRACMCVETSSTVLSRMRGKLGGARGGGVVCVLICMSICERDVCVWGGGGISNKQIILDCEMFDAHVGVRR